MRSPIRRIAISGVVLALLAAACGGTTTASTTTTAPAPADTATPDTAAAPTTTTPPATTTTTEDPLAGLAEAKIMMAQPQLADGGKLEANGAFAESTPGFTPFEDLEVLVFLDGDNVIFYLEGPEELLRSIVIEFDAVDENRAVVADTSYVGDLAVDPPAWAIEAQAGNTVRVVDYPPPDTSAGYGARVISTGNVEAQALVSDELGVSIVSEITTLQEYAEISIWLYGGLVSGQYDYAHYVQLRADLLANADAFVTVAGFFQGILGHDWAEMMWIHGG